MTEQLEKTEVKFIKDVLDGCGYPMIKHPKTMKKDAGTILKYVNEYFPDQRVLFAGTGTSGAMALSAIMMHEDIGDHGYMLIAKSGESSHRETIEKTWRSDDWPIVIVDDFICFGNTLKSIYAQLTTQQLDVKVQAVAICDATSEYRKFEKLFPNIKLIIG